MTQFHSDIRRWILLAVQAFNGPMPEFALKDSIRARFPNVSLTNGHLDHCIRDCEELKLIAGLTDEIGVRLWDLTPKGKIKAQQLR